MIMNNINDKNYKNFNTDYNKKPKVFCERSDPRSGRSYDLQSSRISKIFGLSDNTVHQNC